MRRTHDLLPLDESKPTTRLLVTGSRTWPDEAAVIDALGFYWELGGMLTVVHGDCPRGPDRMAHDWCERMNAGAHQIGPPGTVVVHEERHPAEWVAGGLGAGFTRNRHMVDLGADYCLAFMDRCTKRDCNTPGPHGSHGTDHCATEAEKAGIETVIWRTW